MKIALISDIHANPGALASTLLDIEKKGCDKIICLGDIVGYGYDPNSCIDICRHRNIECFLGNHDAAMIGKLSLDWFNPFARDAILRQRVFVSEDNKRWLDTLPFSKTEKIGEWGIVFTHGTCTVPEVFDYVNFPHEAAREFAFMRQSNINALFVGHTHYANVFTLSSKGFTVDEYDLSIKDRCDWNLDSYDASIVNVGSCGYPRNQPYIIYAIFDTEKHICSHQILPFDFKDYREEMKKIDALPPLWLEEREKCAKENPIQER